MKILLVGERVVFGTDANGNCVWNLAKALMQQGHTVHVMSQAVTKEQMHLRKKEGIMLHWYYIPWNYPKQELLQELHRRTIRGMIRLFKKVLGKYRYRDDTTTLLRFREEQVIEKTLGKFFDQVEIDKTIAAFYPVEFVYALSQLSQKKQIPPYWVYQLDAYVHNRAYTDTYLTQRQKFFVSTFKTAEGIFTTPLLYRDVCHYLPDKVDCITPLEFPLLCEKKVGGYVSTILNREKINCVFAGSLYPGIREPDALLGMLRRWTTFGNVEFHFFLLNKCAPAVINEWRKGLEPCVYFHEKQSIDEMTNIMAQAGILINIGNKVDNQLPSKILDYFSLGRPVVHLAQVVDCPATPYFLKHPCALVLPVGCPMQESAQKLQEFIREHGRDETIPYKDMKQIYKDCSPEAVGKRVINTFITGGDLHEKG